MEKRDFVNTEVNASKRFLDISDITETQNSSIITLGRIKKIFTPNELEKLINNSPITKA